MWRSSCPVQPRRGEKSPCPLPLAQHPGPGRGGKPSDPQPRLRQPRGERLRPNMAKQRCAQKRCTVIAGPSGFAGVQTMLARMSPCIPERISGVRGWQGCRTNTIPSRRPDAIRVRRRPGLPIPFGHRQASKCPDGSAYSAESGASCLAFSVICSSVTWSASISPVWTSTSITPTSPRRPRPGRARNRGTRHTMRSPVTISVGSPAPMPVPTLESANPPTF